MTAVATARPATARRPHSRVLGVVRLQYVNRQTFIWIPLIVLGGAWGITLLIYWLVNTVGGETVMIAGGTQAPLWYYLVVGIYAMTLTFPFSQAMSVTRREFYLGTLIAAAISAAAMATVFILIGLLEQANDGYGLNGYFAYIPWLWEAGIAAAWLTFFTTTMLFFVVGFWFATVNRRLGPLGLTVVILGIVVVLLGFVALVTLQEAWPQVWQWILDTGALGLTLWGLLLTAVLAGGSYLTLRRLPA
ncbi:hypothetical protein [Microbacterium marinilacus]|uniref:ABC transporter permease n=1 Tax=Microbacterium marinilacus TaxID=415209 RepID=A0ABP7BUJ3_9MICO|nr:hypothetical protein [Microbacterium marinilacus]MBY0688260.1 hypothetical protein [Microbacterium marinilacus]